MARHSLLAFVVLLAAFAAAPLHAEDLAARKAELESLSAEQRTQLLERKDRFEQLSPAEQESLRAFHEKLTAEPDADRLRGVLERYHEWLKTLPPGQRADLLAMSEKERVEKIKEIRKEQENQRLRRIAGTKLTEGDIKIVQDWLHEFVERHQAELLALMPADMRSRFEENQDHLLRRRMLYGAMIWQRGEKAIRPGTEDMERLLPLLSAEPRKLLRSVTDVEKQNQLLRNWAGWGMNRQPPQVSDEELTRFYQDPTQLDPKIRGELEALPRDQLFQELRRHYFAAKFPRGGEWRRPGGGGPGGPGGSGPNPGGGGPGGSGRPVGFGPRDGGNRGDGGNRVDGQGGRNGNEGPNRNGGPRRDRNDGKGPPMGPTGGPGAGDLKGPGGPPKGPPPGDSQP